MEIRFIDRSGVPSTQLREFAERRLSVALKGFTPRIARVSLAFADANREGGVAEQWCRLAIALRRAEGVVVTNCDADVFACIADAMDRAVQLLGHELERTRYPIELPGRGVLSNITMAKTGSGGR